MGPRVAARDGRSCVSLKGERKLVGQKDEPAPSWILSALERPREGLAQVCFLFCFGGDICDSQGSLLGLCLGLTPISVLRADSRLCPRELLLTVLRGTMGCWG